MIRDVLRDDAHSRRVSARVLVPTRTVLLVAFACWASACGRPTNTRSEYVGSAVCAGCHADAYQAWTTSDHARAMAVATDSTVLGAFDGRTFSENGAGARFYRDGDAFLIDTHEADSSTRTLRVAYTFGFEPLQQFLVEYDRGRYQAFTVAWDRGKGRWFSLYPDSVLRVGDYVHWSGPGMNWNYMCAECHSTNLRKGYDLARDTYSTTFSEVNVACEACHGAGSTHVAWAEKDNLRAERVPERFGFPVSFSARVPSSEELEVCARCHSRRSPITDTYRPGDRFLDHFRLSLLDEGLYFADGQIEDEVYVYGSFLQSRMYSRGVRCTNCHDAHTGRIRLPDNGLCGQCHNAAVYDVETHFRHAVGSEAARCVTCHMPARTYMQIDPRRDHSFKVPDPAGSARVGSPDVCRSCHPKLSPEALAAHIRSWFGDRLSSGGPVFPDLMDAARSGNESRLPVINEMLRDSSVSAIRRASIVSLVDRFPIQRSLGMVARALRSPDTIVRLGALSAAGKLGPNVPAVLLTPLLADSSAAVRMEVARVLVQTGTGRLEADDGPLREALDAYVRSQHVNDDQPGSHVNLGALWEHLGDDASAVNAYRNALRLDSVFAPALINLGLLYNRQGQAGDATLVDRDNLRLQSLACFKRAATLDGEWGGRASYYLGLLLAEDKAEMAAAATALERAALQIRDDGRIFYNAGLAFQSLGDLEKAGSYLKEAARLAPTDPEPLNALAILEIQRERWDQALQFNRELARLVPDDAGVSTREEYILSRMNDVAGK